MGGETCSKTAEYIRAANWHCVKVTQVKSKQWMKDWVHCREKRQAGNMALTLFPSTSRW